MNLSVLPSVNAVLNGSCAVLLVIGYLFIRNGNVLFHRITTGSAFCVSVVFLASYLTYHATHGSTRFSGTGWIRPVYFAILISHTLLAVAILPLALRTLYLALKGRFEKHKRIARWTLPLWLYVSITGVVVYWMLYQAEWALGCPACQEAVASQGDPETARKLISGFSWSLGLLLSTPYLLFGGITFLVVRSARRAKQGDDAAE